MTTDEENYIYITKSILKEKYHLTDKVIRLLGAADKVAPNPHYKKAPPLQLFQKERVEDFIEGLKRDHPEILEKMYKRKTTSLKAVQSKREKSELVYAKILGKLYIQNFRIEEIPKLAEAQFWAHKSYFGKNESDLEWKPSLNADLAYIRHNLTNYDELLLEIKGKVGKGELYLRFKQQANQIILDTYNKKREELEKLLAKNSDQNPSEQFSKGTYLTFQNAIRCLQEAVRTLEQSYEINHLEHLERTMRNLLAFNYKGPEFILKADGSEPFNSLNEFLDYAKATGYIQMHIKTHFAKKSMTRISYEEAVEILLLAIKKARIQRIPSDPMSISNLMKKILPDRYHGGKSILRPKTLVLRFPSLFMFLKTVKAAGNIRIRVKNNSWLLFLPEETPRDIYFESRSPHTPPLTFSDGLDCLIEAVLQGRSQRKKTTFDTVLEYMRKSLTFNFQGPQHIQTPDTLSTFATFPDFVTKAQQTGKIKLISIRHYCELFLPVESPYISFNQAVDCLSRALFYNNYVKAPLLDNLLGYMHKSQDIEFRGLHFVLKPDGSGPFTSKEEFIDALTASGQFNIHKKPHTTLHLPDS